MTWSKLVFPLAGAEPIKLAFALTIAAQDIDNKAGNPDGFAIFSGWEFGEDNENTNHVLYFSPVAANLCASALAPKFPEPCDPPNREALGFGLAYGPPQSWDLLK